MVRWALRLSEFDFEIRYKKGTENSNVDALSRLPDDSEFLEEEEQNPLEPYLFAHASEKNPLAKLDMVSEQSKDPLIVSIRNSLKRTLEKGGKEILITPLNILR